MEQKQLNGPHSATLTQQQIRRYDELTLMYRDGLLTDREYIRILERLFDCKHDSKS